jgi:hypothetical protein
MSGVYKKEKERLLKIIGELDIKAETIPLGVNEREIKKKVYEDLAKLLRYEEPKWDQRANVKHVQE